MEPCDDPGCLMDTAHIHMCLAAAYQHILRIDIAVPLELVIVFPFCVTTAPSLHIIVCILYTSLPVFLFPL